MQVHLWRLQNGGKARLQAATRAFDPPAAAALQYLWGPLEWVKVGVLNREAMALLISGLSKRA